MEIKDKTKDILLKKILKEPLIEHTATNLAKELKITRQAVWKILKKLSNENLIILKSIAETKKSANKIGLNYKNPLIEKTLSLILIKESLNYERWRVNFAELKDNASFIILFGSILNNPKEANDIDIILVVKNKQGFHIVNKNILKIQQTQLKKIHNLDLTKNELIAELKGQNKAYLDALKKGVILYGQENFVDFIKNLQTK